jgi:hypothetical protein
MNIPKICTFALLLCTLALISTNQINMAVAQKVDRTTALGTFNDSVFLDNVARDTWNYLHSECATSVTTSLPYSWYSASKPKGGNYSNTAEIGLYALSWIAAYDLNRSWSPSWSDTENNVTKILDQLSAWQNSDNSYQKKVFYQWYWVDTGNVSGNPSDKLVPSIDNAWLALSLITIRDYAKETGRDGLESKCTNLLDKMNFTEFWYHPNSHRFALGGINDPQMGTEADYFSNENRIINFVARSLGQLSPEEFNESLKALNQDNGIYDNTTVGKVNWNGAYFTYTAPALFINELNTSYGDQTLIPATMAQIKYARNQDYTAWGLSDCNGLIINQYVGDQGAPPKGMGNRSETVPGLVAPYASALALITPLNQEAIANLRFIKESFPNSYDDSYGFHDSVMVKKNDLDNYGRSSERFSALEQEWIFLSIIDHESGFVWRYFNNDTGVQKAYGEMYA